jgi:hypothetical protein
MYVTGICDVATSTIGAKTNAIGVIEPICNYSDYSGGSVELVHLWRQLRIWSKALLVAIGRIRKPKAVEM